MIDLKGHFGGTVIAMEKGGASIRVETLCQLGQTVNSIGDVVFALKEDFAKQMPGVGKGGHVEGNVVKDTPQSAPRYINVTRIV
jgi:hypothetical protein